MILRSKRLTYESRKKLNGKRIIIKELLFLNVIISIYFDLNYGEMSRVLLKLVSGLVRYRENYLIFKNYTKYPD